MDYYFWIMTCVGGLFCLSLFISLLVRCANAPTVEVATGAAPFDYVQIHLESETLTSSNYPTISRLLSQSNSAYTVNVLCAVLVGITVGFDYARSDGLSALPNLGNLGLILVLLSPGNQSVPENPAQFRDCCCCPVGKDARSLLHIVGMVVFCLGLGGGILWHAALLNDCWSLDWQPHDLTFLVLYAVCLVSVIVWLLLWSKNQCPSVRCQFVWETIVVVGGLALHFAHSVNSNAAPLRGNCKWIY